MQQIEERQILNSLSVAQAILPVQCVCVLHISLAGKHEV